MVSSRNLAIWTALVALLSLLPAPARAADDDRAAKLFPFCAQCHGADGAGNQKYLAPGVAGLPEWYVFAQLQNFFTGQRGMHPDDVAGLRMYPMAKTFKGDRADADMQALSNYIAQLPAPSPPQTLVGGDAVRGANLYQVCIACHGPDASGNEALRAPPLHQQHDWYLLSALQRYKSGVRGSDPRNTNAQIMRGMSSTLVDEQAMKDVIAYIRTLGGDQASAAPAAAPAPDPATEGE
jgi:cytochrome c oxidase subunit 2